MTISPDLTAQDYAKRIEEMYDKMEALVERNFLRKVAALSRRFPNRLVEVSAGMGRVNVFIRAKHTHHHKNARPYTWAGEVQYELNHGGGIEGPKFLQALRDDLYAEAEAIDHNDNRYANYPMINCDSVGFINGEKQ